MGRVSEVKLKINLADMFGELVPDDDEFKSRVAQAVIDRITERTQDNMDKRGQSFTPYSDAYAKKKGVSAGDVDMTDFGDMLANMQETDSTSQTVTIGFPDERENAKAYNHTTGDTVPKRDFFGLPKYELEAIAESFRDELEELKTTGRTDSDAELDDVLQGILEGDFDEEIGL